MGESDNNVIMQMLNEIKRDVAVIPSISNKINRIEARLDELETVKTDVVELKGDNTQLKERVAELETKFKTISNVEAEYKKEVKKLKVQRINQELLSKRWNIIIHGIPQDRNENDGSIEWESRQDSKKKVQTLESKFFTNSAINSWSRLVCVSTE